MRPLGARRSAELTTVLGVFASAFSWAAPSAADLARCAGIADPTTRLACYDAINGNRADGKPSTAAPSATTGAPASTTTPTPTVPAPTAPAPPQPVAASSFASDPQNFGFTQAQRAPQASQNAPKAIKARIEKIVDTRWGQPYAVLDNGQTWVFIDSDQDAGLRPHDPITIRRGTLGSFLLVTTSHHSYHVKRTQ